MRKLAFGYTTRCNIRCRHCVAATDKPDNRKMALDKAREVIIALGQAGVGGISFSAGEPFLYIDDIKALVSLCAEIGIYTRVVTNSFWARTSDMADRMVSELKESGLCQLRLSCSRWHQEHVSRQNVVNAANSCRKFELDYYVSFVTDFSKADDAMEQFLRDCGLMFFPEPVIYAGRAKTFDQRSIMTDYQANCCQMNPYLAPDLEMYACCDAGAHFTKTHFFALGSLKTSSADQLFLRTETDRLYHLIRAMGLTQIASFSGMAAREIITYSKCELCFRLFNDPETLNRLRADIHHLEAWHR